MECFRNAKKAHVLLMTDVGRYSSIEVVIILPSTYYIDVQQIAAD